jgi:hypothetical protein
MHHFIKKYLLQFFLALVFFYSMFFLLHYCAFGLLEIELHDLSWFAFCVVILIL